MRRFLIGQRRSTLLAPTAVAQLLCTFSGACILLSGCDKTKEQKHEPVTREAVLDAVRGKGENANTDSQTTSSPTVAGKETEEAEKVGVHVDDGFEASIEDLAGGIASQNRTETAPEKGRQILRDGAVNDREVVKVAVDDDPNANWTDGINFPNDIWEMTYTGDKPVGYTHRRIQTRSGPDGGIVQVEMKGMTRTSVAGIVELQTIELTTQEKRNGDLLRIEGTLSLGELQNRFSGVVEDSVLKLESTSGGSVSKTRVPWFEDYRGPFAIEQSLLRRPMADNEARVLRHLDPMLGRVVETTLEAGQVGSSPTMLRGTLELREIDVRQRDGDQVSLSKIWSDEKGYSLKTVFSTIPIRAFRVDEKTTRDFIRTSHLLAVSTLTLPVNKPAKTEVEAGLGRLHKNDGLVLKITHGSEDPFVSISRKSLQSIQSLNAREANITVHLNAEDAKDAKVIELETEAPKEALESTEWVDRQSPAWVKFVETVRGDKGERELAVADKAVLLRDSLREVVTLTPFDRQVRNVNSLMRTKRMNSFEQSVVLASLYREEGIPSRVAIGFVRPEGDGEWNLTGWVEYFDGKQWRSIDPTSDAVEIKLDRFKVRESYFLGTDLLEDIAKVANWAQDADVSVAQ